VQSEPFDFKWLTTTVKLAPAASAKLCVSPGRLRSSSQRASFDWSISWNAPTGVTDAGLYSSAVVMTSVPMTPVST
jgi:hypothetical protein